MPNAVQEFRDGKPVEEPVKEPVVEVGAGINAVGTSGNTNNGYIEIPSVETTATGEDNNVVPADAQVEEHEVPAAVQLGGTVVLTPYPNGVCEFINPNGTCAEAPEKVEKAFEAVKTNVIRKDTIAALIKPGDPIQIDDILNSVERLTDFLDKMHIPYDRSKNLIIENVEGSKTAYFLGDDKEREPDSEEKDTQQEIDEEQSLGGNVEDRKIDGRIRDITSVGDRELAAIISAKDKKTFNKLVDQVNSSRENKVETKEQQQQAGSREENENKEKGYSR